IGRRRTNPAGRSGRPEPGERRRAAVAPRHRPGYRRADHRAPQHERALSDLCRPRGGVRGRAAPARTAGELGEPRAMRRPKAVRRRSPRRTSIAEAGYMVGVAAAERIGEILIRDGLISREQLDRALGEARESGHRIGYTLVKLGVVSEHDLALALARQHRVPAVDLERVKLDPKLLKLIPAEVALRHLVVPL